MSPPNLQPQPQTQTQPNSESEILTPQLTDEEKKKKTLPIAILIVRVITLICLLVFLIIIVSNTATIRGIYQVVTIRFNNLNTYRYMVSAIVLGLVYTCLQVASGIQHISTGKQLMNHDSLPFFDLFGDQVVLCLIGTGMGAAFGASVELKKTLDLWDDYFETHGNPFPVLSQSRPKLDNFFNTANLSATFLFFAFFASAVSSLLSSFSLISNKHY